VALRPAPSPAATEIRKPESSLSNVKPSLFAVPTLGLSSSGRFFGSFHRCFCSRLSHEQSRMPDSPASAGFDEITSH
jgi:hypothetical protein